ncbi:ABC transporter F family member 4-like isoform X2 [Crassostrea angulata]|uniref:ABC transporter F family member 4-like isoform X2 n=1 Tax=Magallana angulata TaxID=2784310 RepID=UPI0022B1DECA|nr:ABC transporter F family member 4-like isoform X2 [Crassostrea angulata]
MNKKKEKSGKFPFGKKKKNKDKEAKATEEEKAPLKVATPEEDFNQAPNNHIQSSFVTISKESQGRINERPVDVGDVVVAPQNCVAFTKTSGANPFLPNHQTVSQPTRGNGQPPQITIPTEPKGPSRVHSFSAKAPEQPSSQKEESVTYENENSGRSKKKKGQSFLGSLTGKSSKKARKSLNEAFEIEKTKATQDDTKERQPTNDQESSSSEEMDDHWDDDPRNPFSASFVVEEDHPAQSPISEKGQQNKIADFPPLLEEDRTKLPEKVETTKGSEMESKKKKKKRKLKVPSFRSSKKAGTHSSPPVSPTKSASEPTHLKDTASTETEPAAIVTLRLPQPPEKPPRLHSYSFESPDKLVSEDNTGQFLSREERNKSKQFSSMRVSNKNPRSTLLQTPAKDKVENNKENESDTCDDEELPPNISKKSRQGLKIFSSLRKNKPPKVPGLEKVAEQDAEESKDDDDSEIPNPLSSGYQQSGVLSVRSSAPPNFAAPVMGSQLPPARNNEIDQRARTESAASETLPRIEETRETSSEPKKIRTIRSRIKKTLSLKKSSHEADETRQAYTMEETHEDTIEEENNPPQEIIREEASLAMVYSVQETEVDLEIRKRELESVFKDMESEEEEEEKPKAKNPKQFLKDLTKKKKKKKSDSDEPEAFPLMERSLPVDDNAKKDKNAAEQIVMVKGQLGELKEIAHDNIKKMEEREDNLEDLSERAEKLDEAAGLFHKVAVEVRTEVETCCSKRTKRIILGVVVAVLVLIVIILIAVLSNKSETTEVRTIHIIHVINGTAPYITPSPG